LFTTLTSTKKVVFVSFEFHKASPMIVNDLFEFLCLLYKTACHFYHLLLY